MSSCIKYHGIDRHIVSTTFNSSISAFDSTVFVKAAKSNLAGAIFTRIRLAFSWCLSVNSINRILLCKNFRPAMPIYVNYKYATLEICGEDLKTTLRIECLCEDKIWNLVTQLTLIELALQE